MEQATPAKPEWAEDLRREAGYFRQHQQRMNYLEIREEDWVIGSGMVEGGAKRYQARLCGPGMRWSRKGAENLDTRAHRHPERSLDERWRSPKTAPSVKRAPYDACHSPQASPGGILVAVAVYQPAPVFYRRTAACSLYRRKPMSERQIVTIDGNEAAAYVAHKTNEVIAIYPITPSSNMGEWADAWSAENRKNIWGTVPLVVEMQSEGGAAGAVHGALQTGSLTTTFTASQGLLLMIPNMFKIAGELTSTVFHIAARALAAHALSIFGDHSDVMACRSTGWAMLCSNSPQEVMDLALISQAATLKSRVPFLHFFDGFRTSHEIRKIEELADADIRAMIDDNLVLAHRQRALNPEHPFIRGTAQNPDVYFQAREACNSYYLAVPEIVQAEMDKFAGIVGRQYKLFDYVGAPDAERVIVLMGSSADIAHEAVNALTAAGEKVGIVKVRLYRPFSVEHLMAAIPATAKIVTALDRCKEPGGAGEPLYQDVVTAVVETGRGVRVLGGRYGLASKEFTAAMVKGVFDNMAAADAEESLHRRHQRRRDPHQHRLRPDLQRRVEAGRAGHVLRPGRRRHGGRQPQLDPHHRRGDRQLRPGLLLLRLQEVRHDHDLAPALRPRSDPPLQPDRVGQLRRLPPVDLPGARQRARQSGDRAPPSCSPAPYGPDEVWDQLPRQVQAQIIAKKLRFYVIDAIGVAKATGMGGRINTIMQTCFFAISGVLPSDEAIEKIKESIRHTYGRRGEAVVQQNFAAVDHTLSHLYEVKYPDQVTSKINMESPVPDQAPAFLKDVTAQIIAGNGDSLPVSAFPVDGTWPSATTQWEKRNLALEIPVWDSAICIQCGKCALVCPHAAIRTKVYPPDTGAGYDRSMTPTRRRPAHGVCRWLGMLVAASAAALLLTPGGDAAAAPLRTELQLTSLTPISAQPGTTVRAKGTFVSNKTIDSVVIRLEVGSTAFVSRSAITEAAANPPDTSAVFGAEDDLGKVRRGAREQFTVAVPADDLPLFSAGVFPLRVVAVDATTGAELSATSTFLPWAPDGVGVSASRLLMFWPLVGVPSRDSTGAAVDNSNAAATATGGRLTTLVGSGSEAPATWVVDPALLDDVSSIGTPGADQWVTSFADAAETREVVALPYGDPDVAAVASAGRPKFLRQGQAKADRVYRRLTGAIPRSDLSWPADGAGDDRTIAASARSGDAFVLLNEQNAPSRHTPALHAVRSHRLGGPGGGCAPRRRSRQRPGREPC